MIISNNLLSYPRGIVGNNIYMFTANSTLRTNGSPLHAVATSIAYLKRVAELRPEYTFHLPCPAISNGGKSVDEILPMLVCLPDNVIIYLPL